MGRGPSRHSEEYEKELQIGEDATCARRPTIRTKNLLSICRVPAETLYARHHARRTFRPLYLHAVSGRHIEAEHIAVGCAARAVPFATLAESSADDRFTSLEDAQRTISTHIGHLREHLAELNRLVPNGDHLSAARVRFLETRIPGPARFTTITTTKERSLRDSHDGRVRSLNGEGARLARQIAPLCLPDEGRTEEQPVHERRSFRELQSAIVSAPVDSGRESGPDRRARRRPATGQTRAQTYEERRQDLAALHERSDPEWTSASRAAVIREWCSHIRDEMISRLS